MKTLTQLLFVLLISIQVQAQQKTISGVVSDENGLPLPGASVLIKGTTTGTQTDFDGNYSLQANIGDIITFNYVGYKTQEHTVGAANTINVSLQLDAQLDEVVVIGYGTTRHSHIKKERVKTASQLLSKTQNNQQNIKKALQGRVTGVNVNTTGAAQTIRIRGGASVSGNNKPLIVIDGKIATQKDLENLKSRKVEEIKLAKQFAGEKLYGARGANGVVFVKTKRSDYVLPDVNKLDNESYTEIHENKFEKTSLSPLSTFSIDVDKASYSNIRRMINNGQAIPADAVKIEEMINYFSYQYPQPTGVDPFSINTEVVQTPWNHDTKLVRIGLQGKTYENEVLPPSNLTFLIDVSGSMSSSNKLPLLKSAFKLLVNQLRPKDKVSIVVYAGAAGVVLEPTSGKHKEKILRSLDKLQAGGSTAGGAGIKLAYKLAEQNFNKKGNNRVILATDGDFNVGSSSDSDMEKLIEDKRQSGVFLSVLGFGYGNYKDSKLETLADKGNGNHAYIDTMQEAQKVFGKEFGGTLYTIAKDVKIQVEFNPSKVQAYRLIGYENRLLADEDFKDDTKDAGELGSGHTVTALYEIIPTGVESQYLKDIDGLKYTKVVKSDGFSDELLTVKFRYKKPDGTKSIEMQSVVNDRIQTPSTDMNFASAVALFGMQIRHSQFYNNALPEMVIALAEKGKEKDEDGYRAEFIRLVKLYQQAQ